MCGYKGDEQNFSKNLKNKQAYTSGQLMVHDNNC